MSIELIHRVLEHSKTTGTARLILVSIATHDGPGGAWPSIQTIARHAGVSERTVQRTLPELTDMGELVVFRNAGGNKTTRRNNRTNRYQITIDCPETCSDRNFHRPNRGDISVTPTTNRGDISVTPTNPENPKNTELGVTSVSPEQSLKNLKSLKPPLTQVDHVRTDLQLTPEGGKGTIINKQTTNQQAQQLVTKHWNPTRTAQTRRQVITAVKTALEGGYTETELTEILKTLSATNQPVNSFRITQACSANGSTSSNGSGSIRGTLTADKPFDRALHELPF